MPTLLDTNVLIRLRSGDPLIGPQTRQLLREGAEQRSLAVSAISFHEVSRLCRDGVIDLNMSVFDWCRRCINSGVLAIPVGWEVAAAAPQLANEGFHGDPFDQTIVATAIIQGIPLVTTDKAMHQWADQTGQLELLNARK
ncbi:type II toxin-antitoxin system VapC family toxin [Candidatus Poriferisocius sp.]|uniref:type II toxin-antitoxin system VapC family toxin n=1 Tax=Candidatus Poriferisocius sp. TaxID=3101276 RepID=UPI003B5C0EF9